MSLAAWMPSSLRFFSICLLRAMAARSSADEAQPMAMARTAWLATRGSAVPLACSRPVVARTQRRARASERTRASGPAGPRDHHETGTAAGLTMRARRQGRDSLLTGRGGAAAWARERMTDSAGLERRAHCAGSPASAPAAGRAASCPPAPKPPSHTNYTLRQTYAAPTLTQYARTVSHEKIPFFHISSVLNTDLNNRCTRLSKTKQVPF